MADWCDVVKHSHCTIPSVAAECSQILVLFTSLLEPVLIGNIFLNKWICFYSSPFSLRFPVFYKPPPYICSFWTIFESEFLIENEWGGKKASSMSFYMYSQCQAKRTREEEKATFLSWNLIAHLEAQTQITHLQGNHRITFPSHLTIVWLKEKESFIPLLWQFCLIMHTLSDLILTSLRLNESRISSVLV